MEELKPASTDNLTHSGELKCLDYSVINALRELEDEDDPNLVKDLIDKFFVDALTRLTEISNAINSSDTHKLERSAHSLKTISGNLGAKLMMELCKELEELACQTKQNIFNESEILLTKLQKAFQEVSQVLEIEKNK